MKTPILQAINQHLKEKGHDPQFAPIANIIYLGINQTIISITNIDTLLIIHTTNPDTTTTPNHIDLNNPNSLNQLDTIINNITQPSHNPP